MNGRRALALNRHQGPSPAMATVFDAWIASGHHAFVHPSITQARTSGELLSRLHALQRGDIGGEIGGNGDVGGPTYTADQWAAVIKCVHAKGHLYAAPGDRGAGRLNQAGLDDLTACSKEQGVDLTGVDLSPFLSKTLSDVRDALAALKIIPPVDALPILTTITDILAWIADPTHWLYILIGMVGLGVFVFGTRGLWDTLS